MDWRNIQEAIDYIENNILNDIGHNEIAKQMYSSGFHFHRSFSMLTGITIGEYIRNRKLSLAGQELFTTKAKVIDIALKYGYESPESFTKAFTRFHGVNPSEARISGVNLKFYNPLIININLKGGFDNMAKLEKFEILKFGPYRFIGKSVYARCGQSGYIFGGLWGNDEWIFKKLNSMKEYASDITDDVGFMTFDKYDEQKKLLGYTVGKFMKPDTPVPADLIGTEYEMDYFDIPATFVAKGFVNKAGDGWQHVQKLTYEAIEQQTKYIATPCEEFSAEIYANPTVGANIGEASLFGYYVSCKEKE